MKKPYKSLAFRLFKITGISISVLFLFLFLFPILFPGKIEQEVKLFANKKLNGKLNFKEAKLSFFNHFPSLTLTLTDFSLNGSAPFQNETLVSANDISFGINLKSLVFDKSVKIDKIFIADAYMNVKVNEKGEANYNVYNSESSNTDDSSPSTTELKLEKITIEKSHLKYDDKATKIFINADGFNYVGKGDLNKAIFDLYTDAKIDSFSFDYNGEHYLKNKKVHADLITKINTSSLEFVFQENNLKINQLPVEFKGKFKFLKNGYDLDFNVKSTESNLTDFFTAMPPSYVSWLEKTKVKGTTDILFTLKGKYIASTNQKPDLDFNMKIRDGFISYKSAPMPVSNIYFNFDTKMPSLDTEQLQVSIDSLFFNVNKDYVKAIVKTKGLSKPVIDATVSSRINLTTMQRACGFQNMDLKGMLQMDIKAKGVYDKKSSQVPVTQGVISLKNGYVKTIYYPNPIQNINVTANVSDKLGTIKDLNVTVSPASFVFEGNPIYVQAKLQNFENINYDITAKGVLDLAKIYSVFSRKGLDVKGFINADVTFKGNQQDAMNKRYANLQNKGTLILKNIATTSDYLPKPFVINQGTFKFNQDKMSFTDFKATYGQSDFSMNGYLQNVIDFVFSTKGVLKGTFNLQSNFINCDEFMTTPVPSSIAAPAAVTETVAPASSGVIVVPPNFDLHFVANASKVSFQGVGLENLKGDLAINQGKINLKKSGFDVVGSHVIMDAVYGNPSLDKAFFDFKILAKDFDVKRAYTDIKLFRDMASAAEHAEGIIGLDYKLAGILDAGMQPIYPSLRGGGTLSVKKVKLRGFKMFNAVSEKTGKNGFKNPDMSEVDIKSTIKNNIITVERFKFKFAGFRPRIEGQTSFDGKLNLKMRLGLPPLGIFGIPIKITGTKDQPKIRLGKQTEDLQETEYNGTVPTPLDTKVPVQKP